MTRRRFIALGSSALGAQALPIRMLANTLHEDMNENQHFDVIIVGGSYAGLAAGMALGRALRRVLIVDSGLPANRQTPFSHNFITQDGVPPQLIASKARAQVERYASVEFKHGLVTEVSVTDDGFDVRVEDTPILTAKKLVFATGIRDLLPATPGFAECWGISVLHCPYCHGYEVRDEVTGVLGNGEKAFELVRLISNWTKELTLFTDGPSALTETQAQALGRHGIAIEQARVQELAHDKGQLHHIRLADKSSRAVHALYAMPPFEQHCTIPQRLGCAMTPEGYIQVDVQQRTSIPGIYAAGDSTARLRTVANAVATGTTAGMMLNKELVAEEF
ncbi:MAG TPA: NAD(P)/FAD-dependent oxidoreductase [Flavobacteriales bacterium]|nr:NAD(P)/FAD-dependent oxidoreductase [Flavobacteriales bacterium]HMR27289.1 NAD(P)/FAD-dependent oxidoreductase [Flavobacteriales bacterium]